MECAFLTMATMALCVAYLKYPHVIDIEVAASEARHNTK